jgi:hypothetical protein
MVTDLSEVIEEQRLSLLNVMGIVHCIGMGVANGEKDPPAPEIATAFELLECEIQRIATALERISLRSAMREISTSARLEMRRQSRGTLSLVPNESAGRTDVEHSIEADRRRHRGPS